MTASSKPRRAVVSGGSSGIGRAFVAALHRDGYEVTTCARDAAKLRRLEADFPGVRTYVCDVTRIDEVRRFAAAVTEQRPIDLLISNAGGLCEIDFTSRNLFDQDLTAELRSNLEGAIHLIASFMPALREAAGARIVIVSSGYALAPATRAPVYSAAKAALHSLSKSLRRQFKPLGIGVTEVLPPLVDTPAVTHRSGRKMRPEQVVAQTLAAVNRGRDSVCPGAVRSLVWLLRIWPALAERVVADT